MLTMTDCEQSSWILWAELRWWRPLWPHGSCRENILEGTRMSRDFLVYDQVTCVGQSEWSMLLWIWRWSVEAWVSSEMFLLIVNNNGESVLISDKKVRFFVAFALKMERNWDGCHNFRHSPHAKLQKINFWKKLKKPNNSQYSKNVC